MTESASALLSQAAEQAKLYYAKAHDAPTQEERQAYLAIADQWNRLALELAQQNAKH